MIIILGDVFSLLLSNNFLIKITRRIVFNLINFVVTVDVSMKWNGNYNLHVCLYFASSSTLHHRKTHNRSAADGMRGRAEFTRVWASSNRDPPSTTVIGDCVSFFWLRFRHVCLLSLWNSNEFFHVSNFLLFVFVIALIFIICGSFQNGTSQHCINMGYLLIARGSRNNQWVLLRKWHIPLRGNITFKIQEQT